MASLVLEFEQPFLSKKETGKFFQELGCRIFTWIRFLKALELFVKSKVQDFTRIMVVMVKNELEIRNRHKNKW